MSCSGSDYLYATVHAHGRTIALLLKRPMQQQWWERPRQAALEDVISLVIMRQSTTAGIRWHAPLAAIDHSIAQWLAT